MNHRERLAFIKTFTIRGAKFIRHRLKRVFIHRQLRGRAIRYRHAGPANQGKLLFDRMQLRSLPNIERRWRRVIVQARVLIMFEADAMLRAGCARQKRRRRAAVQVVNNVVMRRAQLARGAGASSRAIPRKRNYSINQTRPVQHGRDPVFQQNVDLRAGQEAPQGKKRGRHQHGIANRAQAHDQHALHR